jgi:hypothetical protein
MLKSILKAIFKILMVAGIFFIIGSFGAYEKFNINFWQTLLQVIIGGVLVYFSYQAHQIIENF